VRDASDGRGSLFSRFAPGEINGSAIAIPRDPLAHSPAGSYARLALCERASERPSRTEGRAVRLRSGTSVSEIIGRIRSVIDADGGGVGAGGPRARGISPEVIRSRGNLCSQRG